MYLKIKWTVTREVQECLLAGNLIWVVVLFGYSIFLIIFRCLAVAPFWPCSGDTNIHSPHLDAKVHRGRLTMSRHHLAVSLQHVTTLTTNNTTATTKCSAASRPCSYVWLKYPRFLKKPMIVYVNWKNLTFQKLLKEQYT